MSYAALFSGGKDSNLALWKAKQMGLAVDWLVTVKPQRDDSYMFHKPNLGLVPKIAKSIGVDLVEVGTEGVKEQELSDLERALKKMTLDGLITGAVASNYQKDRVGSIAAELGLEVFSPLWGMDQYKLMGELMEEGFECVIVSVAAMGFDDSWLGRKIDEGCLSELKELYDRYRINMAGEGGEYESIVLDGPIYDYGFQIVKAEKTWDGHRGVYDITKIKKK